LLNPIGFEEREVLTLKAEYPLFSRIATTKERRASPFPHRKSQRRKNEKETLQSTK
jgi:hypothetical protein